MSTNVIGSDVISIASKIKWLEDRVGAILKDGLTFNAVEELLNMARESKRYNHTMGKNRNVYAHERVPTD
ncbi:hypothetical protein AYL99_11813 [Fonsecaea erecta]|uniref:Uncharacterized protein n=1 Tax=Fonsecaea erecta TaxID=1367422 RepID=A0A178Z409_9EURO|nr:hypothetical protein AYL99_11813 [Fonsecaea erecta]OAP53933.1 hypothetical protein AYL99_11813 [Fonsecaea erecta]